MSIFGGWGFPCISRIYVYIYIYIFKDSSILGTWNVWWVNMERKILPLARILKSYDVCFFQLKLLWYCWWKKSCTAWDVYNPVNNGINYLSTGAGFLPSTVLGAWFGDDVTLSYFINEERFRTPESFSNYRVELGSWKGWNVGSIHHTLSIWDPGKESNGKAETHLPSHAGGHVSYFEE